MSIYNSGGSGEDLLPVLIEIKEKITTLQNASQPTFTLLNINPAFSLDPQTGWWIMPTQLENISDGNLGTSTNMFGVTGAVKLFGSIILSTNVQIPTFTRIQMSLTFGSSNIGRPYLELEANNISNGLYQNIWAHFPREDLQIDQLKAANIDIIVPFSWASLRFTIWDIGLYGCKCRINDLKVWRMD